MANVTSGYLSWNTAIACWRVASSNGSQLSHRVTFPLTEGVGVGACVGIAVGVASAVVGVGVTITGEGVLAWQAANKPTYTTLMNQRFFDFNISDQVYHICSFPLETNVLQIHLTRFITLLGLKGNEGGFLWHSLWVKSFVTVSG